MSLLTKKVVAEAATWARNCLSDWHPSIMRQISLPRWMGDCDKDWADLMKFKMTCKFVKRGQPRPLFLYFLFYSTTILQKNVRLRHDSNSKPWNWRQARCPHDHHTFLKKTNLTNQVWGIFLNGLGNKFSYNTKLNIWWLLGLFYAKTDLSTFGKFRLLYFPTSSHTDTGKIKYF